MKSHLTVSSIGLISLIFICSCGSGGGPPVKTSWEEENLQGKVKSVSTVFFMLDSSGAIIDSASWNNPDPLVSDIGYYNEKGFLIERNVGNGIDKPQAKETYTYNSSNRLTKLAYTEPGYTFIMTYTYNRNGRLTQSIHEMEYSDGTQTKKSKAVYKPSKYDSKGNILKTIVKTDNKKDDYYILNKYDDAGNRTENEIFDMKDVSRGRTLYTYNSKGDMLTEKNINNTIGEEETIFTYDEKGNVLSASYITTHEGKAIPGKTKFEYTFDQQGNWIQRLQIIMGQKASITKRIITYW
jgi:hypothetical protein